MSEQDFTEVVGREAILAHLDQLAQRLDALGDALAANQREYDELQTGYRVALADHERHVTKLRMLDRAGQVIA